MYKGKQYGYAFNEKRVKRGLREQLPFRKERSSEMRQLNVPTPGFGITLHTAIRSGLDQAAEALDAEPLGYDMVTLHRDALHGDDPSFENWTLLSWLAALTTTISVAPLVL